MAKVGDVIEADNAGWRFSGDASTRFDTHVRRSIPFYDESHELILRISDFFLHETSRVYDLGCSTGTLLEALGRRHAEPSLRFIGFDREADMVDIASRRVASDPRIEIECADVTHAALQACDLVIACYTMQFVPPRVRQQVFDHVYEHLNWGGGFLMFEKVRAPDARFQDMMSRLYDDFKRVATPLLGKLDQPPGMIAKAPVRNTYQ